jgi:hypothetical protein
LSVTYVIQVKGPLLPFLGLISMVLALLLFNVMTSIIGKIPQNGVLLSFSLVDVSSEKEQS